jgi:opacity protein-like surface antigen
MKILMVYACVLLLASTAFAADHGPVFSYATPVNSQGEFSFDTGIYGRYGSQGTQFSTGSGFGYGVTPHITVNAFFPVSFGSGSLPETRIMSGSEWSAGASWRFLHSVTSVGKRIESTASLGVVVPGPQQDSGVLGSLHRAPGVAGSLATGFASRSQYLWAGGGYTRFAEASGDRRPDTISWSTVYGYRPSRLRRGYDQWDYRGFAELTGEHTGAVRSSGIVLPDSSSTTVWLGPSVLAIFKDVAIEGGVQGPLFRDVSESIYGRERVRFALNFSYLKYSAHTSSH